MSKDTAYLVLENGKMYKGKYFGDKTAVNIMGELVFSTLMTGYLETLTEKSYYGQIVMQTFPLIGNYGIITEDFEGETVEAKGYIVKSWCEEPSNFRSEGNLDAFLKQKNITGLCGIDTRAVTKELREQGVMNAMITNNIDNIENIDFEAIKNYKIKNAIASVSCKEIAELKGENSKYKVVLYDYGAQESLKRELLKRGCDVYVVPHNTTAEQIKQIKQINSDGIDGIVLSNGPSDPADSDNIEIVNNLKEIIKLNVSIMGIGVGHQLLALANGFKTKKLKHGHRGSNHPVKNLQTGTVYITNQNHGYTVEPESIKSDKARVIYENVNDKSCEGIEYNNKCFSVEFYPESHGGGGDTAFIFDKFIENTENIERGNK